MNCDVTVTADEFKTVHNGLCDLRTVCDRLEGVLAPDLYKLLARARDEIRKGLDGAYEQEERSFSTKSRHYDSVKKEIGIRNSEWSIYSVKDLHDRHPFEGVDRVVYRSHWGEGPVSASVQGLTWLALWVAADACIRDSGDAHHVYIESLKVDRTDPRTLVLSTGS